MDTIDVVKVAVDVERTLLYASFHFTEYTINKIKLMYGHNDLPTEFSLSFGFDDLLDIVGTIEQRFHVYSSHYECVFMLPYSHFKTLVEYIVRTYNVFLVKYDRFLKVIDVAKSNYRSEIAVIDMYTSSSFHNSFAHISRG